MYQKNMINASDSLQEVSQRLLANTRTNLRSHSIDDIVMPMFGILQIKLTLNFNSKSLFHNLLNEIKYTCMYNITLRPYILLIMFLSLVQKNSHRPNNNRESIGR